MSNTSKSKTATNPSGNWMVLQKKLKPTPTAVPSGKKGENRVSRTRPVKSVKSSSKPQPSSVAVTSKNPAEETSFPRGSEEPIASTSALKLDEMRNGESMGVLRNMILGAPSTSGSTKPGAKKYIAIDCEMVGVGIEGTESSLARVSVVNYYGVVEVDEFVQQKERVVDYRTKWSGIRAQDMVRARPFEEVQKKVASLLEGKVLVGHAVHNDLKALLLSHPHFLIRDTQVLASKHNLVKSRLPALRHLVEQEFGVAIQTGEHSSVVDARATMAIFRLHRKTWESGLPKAYFVATTHSGKKPVAAAIPPSAAATSAKRKASTPPAEAETPAAKVQKAQEGAKKRRVSDTHVSGSRKSSQQESLSRPKSSSAPKQQQNPGGGRKGVSSGLSTVVHKMKSGWWKDLSGSS